MKDVQENDDPVRAFLTRADHYLATPDMHGRTLAIGNVESALEKAASPDTKIMRRWNMDHPGRSGQSDVEAGLAAMHSTGSDAARRVTTLDMPDGSKAIHTAWRRRQEGWIVEIDLRNARHGDCRVEIRTGMRTDPVGILPERSSDEEARGAVMLALSCALTHLQASTNAGHQDTHEEQEASFEDADLALARTETTERSILYVQHATPWSPIRVVDRAEDVDVPVDQTIDAPTTPCGKTRLRVSTDADGGSVVLHARGTMTQVPDPLTRLRILTNALKAAS
jgi:hypothetical protein